MKSTRKIVVGIAAVASLGLAAAVYAQSGPGYGYGPGYGPGAGMGPMGMHAPQGMPGARGPGGNFDPAAMIDARMAYLKTALKITGDQEGAWSAFAATVKQQAEAMKAARVAAVQNVNAAVPDRMAQHITMTQLRLDNLKALQPQVTTLYAALSADQKAIADKILGKPRMGFARHGL